MNWQELAVALGVGTVTVTAGIIGYLAVLLRRRHQMYAHIPGPQRESFWLGNLPGIIKFRSKEGKPMVEYFLQCAEKYGETFVIWIVEKPFVFCLNPKDVQSLLVTGGYEKHTEIYKELFTLYGKRFMGRGILTELDKDTWTHRRAVYNPAFHRSFLRDYMKEFNENGDALLNILQESADGSTEVPMLSLLNRTTMDVIGKVAFNMDVGALEDENNPFPVAVCNLFTGFSKQMNNPLRSKIPYVDKLVRQNTRDGINLIRKTGTQLLQARSDAVKNGDNVPNDMLAHLLKSQDTDSELEGEKLNIMLDDFMQLFIAGQETTANTLGFIVMELGRRKDVFEKLQKEVDEVMGVKQTLTFDDISKLEYMTQVIKEGLRLGGPVGNTFRESPTDTVVGGYKVPAHTILVVSLYSAQRYTGFHNEPLKFNPDRFHPDHPDRPQTYTFMPFSLGPRNCIGQNFAMMEMKVILSKMVQNFEWKNEQNESFEVIENTTLKPKDGVKIILTYRNK